ncbi:unnamed protein product [Blepharisma stoltei]|uniref:Uncharacterized protein n=1 Tax=Blepharisma stoltei TaxID=1481888 RepID=A0AAU9I830_9CILI|nr:unnamed protein product [Blepharisma stoltei]
MIKNLRGKQQSCTPTESSIFLNLPWEPSAEFLSKPNIQKVVYSERNLKKPKKLFVKRFANKRTSLIVSPQRENQDKFLKPEAKNTLRLYPNSYHNHSKSQVAFQSISPRISSPKPEEIYTDNNVMKLSVFSSEKKRKNWDTKQALPLSRVSPDLTNEKVGYSITKYSRPFYITKIKDEDKEEFLPNVKNENLEKFLNRFDSDFSSYGPPKGRKGLNGWKLTNRLTDNLSPKISKGVYLSRPSSKMSSFLNNRNTPVGFAKYV